MCQPFRCWDLLTPFPKSFIAEGRNLFSEQMIFYAVCVNGLWRFDPPSFYTLQLGVVKRKREWILKRLYNVKLCQNHCKSSQSLGGGKIKRSLSCSTSLKNRRGAALGQTFPPLCLSSVRMLQNIISTSHILCSQHSNLCINGSKTRVSKSSKHPPKMVE